MSGVSQFNAIKLKRGVNSAGEELEAEKDPDEVTDEGGEKELLLAGVLWAGILSLDSMFDTSGLERKNGK